jgi:hypothetical protein
MKQRAWEYMIKKKLACIARDLSRSHIRPLLAVESAVQYLHVCYPYVSFLLNDSLPVCFLELTAICRLVCAMLK